MNTVAQLIRASRALARTVDKLSFAAPVAHVYNPLRYARRAHEMYIERYGGGPKRVVFLGMNPGPFGMMQTGVPFGEIAAVRDWLGIETAIARPAQEHPKRLIEGFACTRAEVSGARLWGLFAQRYGSAESFFAEHFVVNYCPLAFLETTGRNRTPDKLPAAECEPLYRACDAHLREVVAALQAEWLVGVGAFAAQRAHAALGVHAALDARGADGMRFGRILHPSPASPAANRDWAGTVTRQLVDQGIWPAVP